jgi:hypothetical protein
MKKLVLGSLIVGVLGAAAMSAPANASDITETYAFTLGNFVDVTGNTASPLKTISGSFTITFDPSAFADNQTMGLVVNYLTDTNIASPIGYTNDPAGTFGPQFPDDFLAIGGIQNDADYIATGTDDFSVNFKFLNPEFAQFALCSDGYLCGNAPGNTIASGYTLAGYPDDVWLPGTGSIRQVPEPGSLALLGAGLAGFGAFRFRQRRERQAASVIKQ